MHPKKLVCLLIGLSIAMIPFFVSHAYAQTKPIEMTYSSYFPATHAIAAISDQWAKEIEKRTNGRVKITIFWSETLTPATKSYEGVINGISDIAIGACPYTTGRFPLSEVADLPLGAVSAVLATNTLNEYYHKFHPKEFDQVKMLYLFGPGPSLLHSVKTPINKLEDLKGMKVRAGGNQAKIAEALGGVPVAIPIGDAYDALSKGIADATIVPCEALEGWRLAEVLKYTTYSYGSSSSSAQWVVMNKAKWNALPPDIQKIIDTLDEEYIPKTANAWDAIDKSGRDYALKFGHKFITLSKEENQRFVTAVKPVLDKYVRDSKAKGLPGDEVLKFWQDRLSKHP